MAAGSDPAEIEATATRARVFAGFAGWGPGSSRASSSATTGSSRGALPSDVFTDAPDALWSEVLDRKGGEYALVARMPLDPAQLSARVRCLTPPTPRSAPGAAGASCTSASRSTTSAWSRCCAPTSGIRTVITADTYGAGDADALLGRALAGLPRERYCARRRVGHDFYEGEREGAKGFPRFTDPRLRGPDGYADYLRMATERSRSSAAASTASTCCCCTTPTAPATRPSAVVGRAWRRCATRA